MRGNDVNILDKFLIFNITNMRWSRAFIPTLREDPADAEVISHRLLLRAGMVRQLGAGIYSYLPLAQRVIGRITNIIREEMNRIGGQEFYLPALAPREIWEESGRWSLMGDTMFRLRDRKGADLCLCMTHEEIFTSIARNELRSYKQLPQIWYQIQTKFRDEPRPKSGLLRVRQFTMKDSYSFDVDQNGLDVAFENHRECYKRIFDRCGLKYTIVEASSGAMGGSTSSEFMVKTDAGEDLIAVCETSGYAANLEKATSIIPTVEDGEGPSAPEEFPTPGVRTIDDLTAFPGGASAERQIKTLVYRAIYADQTAQFILVLVRGDHQLHETKLLDSIAALEVRQASQEEVFELLGAHVGSLGAVGVEARANKFSIKIVADNVLRDRSNMTTGANKDDHHLRGVDIARDIEVDLWADLRIVRSGELSPDGKGTLEVFKALEVGHIFKLGTRYSNTMHAYVLTQNAAEVPLVMGSYGIGAERIMAAAIELSHDPDGIIWPQEIAPFDAVVTATNINQPEIFAAGKKIYQELQAAGFEVLFDDRDERAGVKFKDADLIGIPFRITIGKSLARGLVEFFDRKRKSSEEVTVEGVAEHLRHVVAKNVNRA